MQCSECANCSYTNSGYYVCLARTGVPYEQAAILPNSFVNCEKFTPKEETLAEAHAKMNAVKQSDTHYITFKGGDALAIMKQAMTKEQYKGFLWGNVIKYALRFGRKDAEAKEAAKIADYARLLQKECEE